jgi:hypothetical protein
MPLLSPQSLIVGNIFDSFENPSGIECCRFMGSSKHGRVISASPIGDCPSKCCARFGLSRYLNDDTMDLLLGNREELPIVSQVG